MKPMSTNTVRLPKIIIDTKLIFHLPISSICKVSSQYIEGSIEIMQFLYHIIVKLLPGNMLFSSKTAYKKSIKYWYDNIVHEIHISRNEKLKWVRYSGTFYLNIFRMDFFGAAHGEGGGQKDPHSVKSVTHILQWWNLAQLYLT